MTIRHEPFEECRCCDRARADIELYKREILSADATVMIGKREMFVPSNVKAEMDRLRNHFRQIETGVAIVMDDDLGKEVEVEMDFDQAQAIARAALQPLT